jgi:hypothetical protein
MLYGCYTATVKPLFAFLAHLILNQHPPNQDTHVWASTDANLHSRNIRYLLRHTKACHKDRVILNSNPRLEPVCAIALNSGANHLIDANHSRSCIRQTAIAETYQTIWCTTPGPPSPSSPHLFIRQTARRSMVVQHPNRKCRSTPASNEQHPLIARQIQRAPAVRPIKHYLYR